ncbi:MAG: LamG-like jellyroll fold domain-containing protein [Gammaproteobacteria bacterium]
MIKCREGLRKVQSGMALLPVAIMIAVVGSIALLINSQSAMNISQLSSQNESINAEYIAQAGLQHAVSMANSVGCTGYALSTTTFGDNSYQATFTPSEDSPVSITATGTLGNGNSRTITRENIKIYNPTTNTVILQPGNDGIDTFIEGQSTHTDHNKETDKNLKVDSEQDKMYRTLIQFDLSSVPSSVLIESAILELYLEKTEGANELIEAHAVTRAWNEAEVTWEDYANNDRWTSEGGDYEQKVSGSFTPSGIGWNTLDITGLTQIWLDDEYPNYGVILLSQPTNTGDNVKEFYSSDKEDANLRPKFTITYRCECGVGPCAAPPSEQPIAHWKFDDESGLIAIDSENTHDGILINGVSWSSGILQGDVLLDGNNDYIEIPHSDALSLTHAMTFTAWARTLDVSSGYKAIITKDSSSTNDSNYWFGIEDDELVFGFSASGDFREVKTSGANILAGSWNHFSASFNNDTDEVILYINGVQVAVGSISHEPTAEDAEVLIGSSIDGEYWEGELDDVRIYNRALSNDEITELSILPASLPIAHWMLDDANGLMAIDSIGGHNGTLENGPVWITNGKIDGALDFDGKDDRIVIPHTDALSITEGLTISAWINNESESIVNAYRILSKEKQGSSDNFWLAMQSGWLWMGVGGQFFSPSVMLNSNQWYHVAGTFDKETGVVNLYIDGVAVLNQSTSASLEPNNDELYIGSNWENSKWWDGLLDDVRLYNYALSTEEIAKLASVGLDDDAENLGSIVDEGSASSKTDNCTGTFRDEFNTKQSYSGSDGTLAWSTKWLEINESDGPESGDERVTDDDDSEYVLQIRDNDGQGEGVQREMNLSSYAKAVFSFQYRRDGFDNNNDYVNIGISSNGGDTWKILEQIVGAGTDSSYVSRNYDISDYINANTRIQFLTSDNLGGSDEFYIDNVQIDVSECAE